MYRGFSIRLRLLLGLLLLGSLTAIVSLTGVRNVTSLSNSFDEVNRQATPKLTAILQIEAVSSRLLADFVTFQSSAGSSTQDGTAAAMAKNELLADLENLRGYQSDYNEVVQPTTESRALNSNVEQVLAFTTELITNREQGATLAQVSDVQTHLHAAIRDLEHTVVRQVNAGRRDLRDRNEAVLKSASSQIRSNIALTIIAIILALLIAVLTARSIVGPIQRLRDGAQAIAEGNLKRQINVRSRDELGELAAAFNNMSQKLQQSYADLERSKAGVERTVKLRTQELTEEKARFLASIQSLPLGFMLVETTGSIAMMNPVMRHMLELTDKELTGQIDDEKLRQRLPLFDEITSKSQEAIKQRKTITVGELSSGNRFLRLLLSPVTVAGGKHPIAAVALVEDITEDKILQRSRDEFFSIASHELRTPLTAIRGNTSMMQDYYGEKLDDPSLKEIVGDIHNSSIRLITIVNDFLDSSRLEQGKMQFTMTDFAMESVIEKVVYELDGLSHEKKIYLRMANGIDTLPLVHADADRVKQVLYNLIGNAMRFVEKGGVTIQAEVVGAHLKVNIIDTGKGISPEGQNLLFHKFQQAGASILTRDNTRGTGLGLYISRLLIKKMNGAIKLEHSEEGKGSTFSFTVPLAKSKAK
jgi:signal transduction histidine kinase